MMMGTQREIEWLVHWWTCLQMRPCISTCRRICFQWKLSPAIVSSLQLSSPFIDCQCHDSITFRASPTPTHSQLTSTNCDSNWVSSFFCVASSLPTLYKSTTTAWIVYPPFCWANGKKLGLWRSRRRDTAVAPLLFLLEPLPNLYRETAFHCIYTGRLFGCSVRLVRQHWRSLPVGYAWWWPDWWLYTLSSFRLPLVPMSESAVFSVHLSLSCSPSPSSTATLPHCSFCSTSLLTFRVSQCWLSFLSCPRLVRVPASAFPLLLLLLLFVWFCFDQAGSVRRQCRFQSSVTQWHTRRNVSQSAAEFKLNSTRFCARILSGHRHHRHHYQQHHSRTIALNQRATIGGHHQEQYHQ